MSQLVLLCYHVLVVVVIISRNDSSSKSICSRLMQCCGCSQQETQSNPATTTSQPIEDGVQCGNKAITRLMKSMSKFSVLHRHSLKVLWCTAIKRITMVTSQYV